MITAAREPLRSASLVANVSLRKHGYEARGAGEIACTLACDAGLGPSLVC